MNVAVHNNNDSSADAGRDAALEIVEGARETEWENPSFVAEMFMGRTPWDIIFPFPAQSAADKQAGDLYLNKLERFLRDNVDSEAIDESGELSDELLKGLSEMGCFGLKIPAEYGGLGFSQTNYDRAMLMVASHCSSTAVLLSAHQSIGLPQPLKLFGTEEQKQEYLPKMAAGAVSAFALTEPDVGSDPAKMTTTATPTEDGEAFLLNGEKLWCTNGTIAKYMVVLAQTPPKVVNGREKKQITAFIVDIDMPGLEIAHRCRFMGLKAIQNAVLRFTNVRVPRKNIVWEEGRGLKLALTTLNTGRLTLPATCAGASKRCLEIVRDWVNTRVQWGVPVGKHEAISMRLARMASATFAMDAATWLACGLVDRGGADIRLEAAMAKMYCSEALWDVVNDAMQVKGGRGYETATSLKSRGERPDPIERIMRDCRINMIFEGSSEIMRLFMAREALDPHLSVAGALIDPRSSFGDKVKSFLNCAKFYSTWYPAQWLYNYWAPVPEVPANLRSHLRFVQRGNKRLGRSLFHAMLRFGPGLERRQMVLWRAVDLGCDLFMMAAVCAYAAHKADDRQAIELADHFCRDARKRVKANFANFCSRDDAASKQLAKRFMDGDLTWLEEGAIH